VKRLTRFESKERTRSLLLEAARACVAEKGYDGTSVADIADRAGFTKGAFFSNFETKEDAFLEVLRIEKTRDAEMLREILKTPDLAALSQILNAYIDGLGANRDCAILDVEMQLHASRTPHFLERYETLSAEMRGTLGQFVSSLFAHAGKQSPMPDEDLAELFLSLFQGLMVRRAAQPGEQIRRVLDALVANAPQRP
jgi:AcrR family transcriptional regulator